MNREQGYFNLDSLESKLKLIEYAVKRTGILYHVDIDGEKYFFKECGYRDAITELLSSELLSKIGIPNVKYDLTKFKYKKGVISKSFKKEGFKYTSGIGIINEYLDALEAECEKEKGTPHGDVLREEYEMYKRRNDGSTSVNNLELIMHAVEHHVRNRKNPQRDFKNIMNSLVKYYLTDILILNQDRNRSNWWIEENDDSIEVCPAFDHGEAIRESDWKSIRVEPFDESRKKANAYSELESFISKSDYSYFEEFVRMRNGLSLEILDECFGIVESKIKCEIKPDIKEKIREIFKGHIEKIDEIIERRKRENIDYTDPGDR